MRTGILADNLHSSINFIHSFLPLAPCCQHLYNMATTQEVSITAAQEAVVEAAASNVAAAVEVVAATDVPVAGPEVAADDEGTESTDNYGRKWTLRALQKVSSNWSKPKKLRTLRCVVPRAPLPQSMHPPPKQRRLTSSSSGEGWGS
eukprot:1897348-Amphidinium_carterae.2